MVGFRTQTLASLEARIRDSQLQGTIKVSHRVPSGSASGASSEPKHATHSMLVTLTKGGNSNIEVTLSSSPQVCLSKSQPREDHPAPMGITVCPQH